MMRDIVWLASYPKSGNTWFRFVLFYLHHNRMPENSRKLDEFINSKIPIQGSGKMHFCKTHASCHRLTDFQRRTSKAIYIYRHPLDVMQSALNYALLTGELDQSENKALWVENYIAARGNPLWQHQPYDAEDWNRNVQSWLSVANVPVLLIGYEQALKEPKAAVARLSSFLDLDISDDKLQQCATATSFKQLKAFEENELQQALNDGGTPKGRFSTTARLKSSKAGVRFFNKGKSGDYRNAFTDSQCERAWAGFKTTAMKLGYSFENEATALQP